MATCFPGTGTTELTAAILDLVAGAVELLAQGMQLLCGNPQLDEGLRNSKTGC
jgi:hypothetical protein